MVYEFVLKLFGKSAVELISLLPFILSLNGHQLDVDVVVTEPCTKEIVRFVTTGHAVSLRCDISVVINDKQLFRQSTSRELTYENIWYCDGDPLDEFPPIEQLFHFSFEGFQFDPNDHVEIFSVVTIEDDDLFEQSTGFKLPVLWNYYKPSLKQLYVFQDGVLNVDD